MGHASLQLIHSAGVIAPKPINQHQRESIASRCLIHGASRWTVAEEYGVRKYVIDDICDEAMFERGRRVGINQARFMPPIGRAA